MDFKWEMLAQSSTRKESVRLILGVQVWGRGTKEVKNEDLNVRVDVFTGGVVPYKVVRMCAYLWHSLFVFGGPSCGFTCQND